MFKRFADDYETQVTTDEAGHESKKAVYRGKYYTIDLTEPELVRFRKLALLLLAAMACTHVGAGFVANSGMYQFYVSLPYVLAFFPMLYLAAGILRLPREQRKFRRDEVGLSFDRMKTTSHSLLILLGIGGLGEIVYLAFISDGSQLGLELFFLAFEAFAAGAVFWLIRLQRKIQIRIVPEE